MPVACLPREIWIEGYVEWATQFSTATGKILVSIVILWVCILRGSFFISLGITLQIHELTMIWKESAWDYLAQSWALGLQK